MTKPFDGGVQAVYDFWLGMIPQFFGPLGVGAPAGDKATSDRIDLPLRAVIGSKRETAGRTHHRSNIGLSVLQP